MRPPRLVRSERDDRQHPGEVGRGSPAGGRGGRPSRGGRRRGAGPGTAAGRAASRPTARDHSPVRAGRPPDHEGGARGRTGAQRVDGALARPLITWSVRRGATRTDPSTAVRTKGAGAVSYP